MKRSRKPIASSPKIAALTTPTRKTPRLVESASGPTSFRSEKSAATSVIGVESRKEKRAAAARFRPEQQPGRHRDAAARDTGRQRQHLGQPDHQGVL